MLSVDDGRPLGGRVVVDGDDLEDVRQVAEPHIVLVADEGRADLAQLLRGAELDFYPTDAVREVRHGGVLDEAQELVPARALSPVPGALNALGRPEGPRGSPSALRGDDAAVGVDLLDDRDVASSVACLLGAPALPDGHGTQAGFLGDGEAVLLGVLDEQLGVDWPEPGAAEFREAPDRVAHAVVENVAGRVCGAPFNGGIEAAGGLPDVIPVPALRAGQPRLIGPHAVPR